ncbi:MAG: hypothetical protein M3O35_12430 [Acidobacteriota bacterium]|nr:hypothetical protein [Acidobacteriota bacterium]
MLLSRMAALAALSCALVIAAAKAPPRKPAKKAPAKAAEPAAAVIVERWMHSMTLPQKIAQLIVMPIFGESIHIRSRVFKQYQHMVRDLEVGGLIVLGHVRYGTVRNAEPYAMAALLNRLQKMSKVPLLVGADFERGASMRVNSTTAWPYNMAFAAARDWNGARFEGAETAREARALGIQWIFAPVADVNNNADNPIINIRSYGSSPQDVSSFVKAYIAGAHSDPKHPVLVTAKHFPGHGDTAQDSHMELARLEASRERINTVELAPFRAAIEAGVDTIMTAHMAVPALEPKEIPATVSTAILTDLLRTQMKFPGIIVTDAMDMQGLTKLYEPGEAAVRALEAGADVLLMPKNAEEAIDGVAEAVRSGRLTVQRVDRSLERILTAKVHLGLHKTRMVDLDAIGDAIATPEAEQQAQKVADHALTLLRDGKDMFPLRNSDSACVLALTENKYGQQGRQLVQELKKRSPKMNVQLLDPSMSAADLNDAAQADVACTQIVVAAYVSVSAYRGNVALAGDYQNFVNGLLAGKAPVALVSLGNPYLLRAFPIVQTYATTYSPTPPSETALVKALFGEIPITGKLPVSIPGIAKYGDGIQLPAAAPKKGQ